jgi:hypothetical protein
LRLGGQSFDKGLGVHSRTALTYRLDGKYRRFEAVVGLDDASGRRGHVTVRILVDGVDRTPETVRELAHGGGAKAVRVDLRGAKALTLDVDFGRGADVQDHLNWGDARLIVD